MKSTAKDLTDYVPDSIIRWGSRLRAPTRLENFLMPLAVAGLSLAGGWYLAKGIGSPWIIIPGVVILALSLGAQIACYRTAGDMYAERAKEFAQLADEAIAAIMDDSKTERRIAN